MNALDLQNILCDENKKLTLIEFKDVCRELKQDCGTSLDKYTTVEELRSRQATYVRGEENAYHIILRLLEHVEVIDSLPNFDLDKLPSVADIVSDFFVEYMLEQVLTDIAELILESGEISLNDLAVYSLANYGEKFFKLIVKLQIEHSKK